MVRSLFILFLVINSMTLQAQTISVGTYTDTTDYLVGDFINYRIEAVTVKGVEIVSPSLPDTLKQLELISREEPVVIENDKSKTVIYKFVLAGYDSVSAVIPAVMLEYRTLKDSSFKKIATDSIIVNIHTVPVSTAEEIKDVKSPITIPYDWKLLLLWIAIIIIVFIAGRYFYKRYLKKKAEAPVEKEIIVIPADVKAFTALDNLEREQLWQKGLIKEYHSRITEIIRSYFEERFDLHALELTTTETMQSLKNSREAENILGLTYEFLSNADLVKFAKYHPIESLNEEMMSQARSIVQNTIPIEKVIPEMEEVNA